MPLHSNVLVSNVAYHTIATETEQSPGSETGGILVGRQVNYQKTSVLIVMFASGPGKHADRSPTSFSPDHISHLEDLREWRRQYTEFEIDFVGEWHKHPLGLPAPTIGDVYQAIDILNDPDYILPHGGILIPITQLDQNGCELRMFYITREKPSPVFLSHQIVTLDVLEAFLEECLSQKPTTNTASDTHSVVIETIPFSSPNARKSGRRSSSQDLFGSFEGQRILIGKVRERVDKSVSAERPNNEEIVFPQSENMAQQGLLREIRRLDRMGKSYGFVLERSPGAGLDYVNLVFKDPMPIPVSRKQTLPTNLGEEVNDDISSSEDEKSVAMPALGELAKAIRIAFPHDYPEKNLSMWVIGDKEYPVKSDLLHRELEAQTLEQKVEVVLQWLIKPQRQDLPSLIDANAEFLYRQGVRVARVMVNKLDDLVNSLEQRSRHTPIIHEDANLL
jgi:hypothetical protein